MINDIIKDADQRMGKSVAATQREMAKIRTGRAHPSLIEHLTVDYYGSDVPITQAANVTVEDARTLAITVWEKDMVQKIEKAIITGDLGLNPATSGTVIRIPLPPLTEERRKEFVKIVRQEVENGRIAIRNVRRDAISDVKELLKEKEISEDEERAAETRIQGLTDKHIADLDGHLTVKETELMEV